MALPPTGPRAKTRSEHGRSRVRHLHLVLIFALTFGAPARALENNPAWADQRPAVIERLIASLEPSSADEFDRGRLRDVLLRLAKRTPRLAARLYLSPLRGSASDRVAALSEEFVRSARALAAGGGEIHRQRALEAVVNAYLIAGATTGTRPRLAREVRLLTLALVSLGFYGAATATQAEMNQYGVPTFAVLLGLAFMTSAQTMTQRFDRNFSAPEYAPVNEARALIDQFWFAVADHAMVVPRPDVPELTATCARMLSNLPPRSI